jgi:hypothetical protein
VPEEPVDVVREVFARRERGWTGQRRARRALPVLRDAQGRTGRIGAIVSTERLDLVRDGYVAWNRGDFEAMRGRLGPDVELVGHPVRVVNAHLSGADENIRS